MEILTFGNRSKSARVTAAAALCLAAFTLLAIPAAANNIQVANTVVSAPAVPGDAAKISFDISWENSWRYTNETDNAFYHDAAWVFFKVATEGEGLWRHAVLSAAGTDPSGFDQGTAGANIEMIVPADRLGVFIRRSLANEGHGTLASTNVTVLWHPQESGISSNATARARTMAIEMVYVAEGAFWAGDGASHLSFTPTLITNPVANTVPVSIGGGEYQGGYPFGQTAPDADWPNGYNAFYLMKYLVTQGQYTDFLNALTQAQAMMRETPTASSLYTRNGAWPNYTCARPYQAKNWMNWTDIMGYLDWAALRPFTELEFEKACRGTNAYVAMEYAWGTDSSTTASSFIGTVGSGVETADPAAANYSAAPIRVGIFAGPNSTRAEAGAGYWGNLDLSSHIAERIINIAHVEGRAFTGTHGDGELSPYGNANVVDWPPHIGHDLGGTGGVASQGRGKRGGTTASGAHARTSARGYTTSEYQISTVDGGFRGARTAP